MRFVPVIVDWMKSGRAGCRSVGAMGVLLVALMTGCPRSDSPPPEMLRDATATTNAASRALSPEMAAALAELETREQQIAQTLWAPELRAQTCGRTIDRLWNAIKGAAVSNRLEVAAGLDAAEWILPEMEIPRAGPHGVFVAESARGSVAHSRNAWMALVRAWSTEGWQLRQVELRHVRFEADADGNVAHSVYQFSAHLNRESDETRPARALVIEGSLRVDWDLASEDGSGVPVARVDARGVRLAWRDGPPPFREVVHEVVQPGANTGSIDPVLVQDLDGDGRSEVVLAAQNRVYRAQPDGTWLADRLCDREPGLISTALFAEVTGDGKLDLVVMRHEGLRVLRGTEGGRFPGLWETAWDPPAPLAYPMALTGGDVDGDGDVDLYLAQYKVPYELGLMPRPFDDARDGHRSVLLLNDGRARFRDASEASRVGSLLYRRSYAASLVDLDEDRVLDLALVSDFAGIDLLRGIQGAAFEDRTASWIPERRAFGMGHAFSDFDGDGRLDILMMGMTSATASRLEHLGLWREGAGADRVARTAMTHGNRLYLARREGGYTETSAAWGIAASGWSWGCAAFDADNDGYPEVYVANGLESRESVEDYESHYWMHDAYVGGTNENPVAYVYFMSKFSRTRGRGQSYGGYDKNRFFLNRQGTRFEDVGHLFGVAYEEDSRNVVADDLDGDGRVDLVMTGFEPWPQSRQNVRFLRNELPNPGDWVGVQVGSNEQRRSPLGVRVEMAASGRRSVRVITSGDSHRSQHAATVHFGLGAVRGVDAIRVTWPGGASATLRNPEVNRYHRVGGPD